MKTERLTVGPIQTNCYLLLDEDTGTAAVIDPGAEPDAILARLNATGCRAALILLTHGHFDHIGGVARVKAVTGAPVYAAEAERALLLSSAANLSSSFGSAGVTVIPDRLLRDGETFTLGGLTFTMTLTPGHTAGSCCYRCGDTLFSGDTLFCGSCGRIDFPTGSAADMNASLAKLFALPGDCRVFPGHGPGTYLSAERRQQGGRL